MRGVKGTSKMPGDPCSRCGEPLTPPSMIPRKRGGSYSHCRACNQARANKKANARRNRHSRSALRALVLKAYGDACACCAETRQEFL